MKNTKAQVGPKELFIGMIGIFLTAIIGFIIYANVFNSAIGQFPNERKNYVNESTTISVVNDGLGDNSTLLLKSGFIVGTDIVKNGTAPFQNLTRNVHYKITINGPDGDLTTRANFTLLNASGNKSVDGAAAPTGYNNTALFITYQVNEKSASRSSAEKQNTTTLSAFELLMVGLIVFAAATIISLVYMLGNK